MIDLNIVGFVLALKYSKLILNFLLERPKDS